MCLFTIYLYQIIKIFVVFVGILGTSEVTSNVWSAIFAVIVLHIALGLYIRRAYYEADKIKPEEKVD